MRHWLMALSVAPALLAAVPERAQDVSHADIHRRGASVMGEDALRAVHGFLRYQIAEHETRDSLSVEPR